MAEPKYSFDSACYDLAEHFYPGAPAALLNELAQRFQHQAESSPEQDDWFERKTQHDADEAERAADARAADSAAYYP